MIALFMIVKNEEKIIERCLTSLLPYVQYYCITDTGSTDRTVSVINHFLEKNKRKGYVFEDYWENFGQNRTKSMKNATDWLIKENISLTDLYLLTIDADMKLQGKIEIPFKTDIVYLSQKNGDLSYYNIRLFNASYCIEKKVECIGVTHEYWNCENASEIQYNDIWIDDQGDGGCKTDKFKRDIFLLEKAVMEDKYNKRNWFYLARSYEDIGNVDKAIDCYKKRIDLEGWKEEIYISYKQLGFLFFIKNEVENAIESWIKAYELLPERIETLFYLSVYYQKIGDAGKAFYLLLKCLETPYPKNCILFIEDSIYNYKILEELSLICFNYQDYIELGRKICLLLLFKRNVPDYIKESTKWNYLFYLRAIPFQSHQYLSLPLSLPLFLSTSASLFPKENGNVEGVVRYVNYFIDDKGNYKGKGKDESEIITKNVWYDGMICKEINIPLPKRNHHIKGIEDIRLVYDKINNLYYGIGVSWEYGEYNTPSVCFLRFNEEKEITSVVQVPYEIEMCQKNWTAYMNENDVNVINIIYSHYPFTLLQYDIDNNKVNVLKKEYNSLYDLSSIRGSANPIKITEDGVEYYLCLVHQTIFDRMDMRRYVHLFLKYSMEWELKGISDSFFFKELFIEFSLCIYKENENIVISYSVKDNTTEMISINYKNIDWFVKNDNHILNIEINK